MNYRTLGRTGLKVSEIGYGGEHITDADFATTKAILNKVTDSGINIIDVFMPQANVRENMGNVLKDIRKNVILQGHIGATLNGEQYERSRDPKQCDIFVEDFLRKFHTDYIDLGMIHFVDTQDDFEEAFNSEYIEYVKKLKQDGKIRFIGASSHNAITAKKIIQTNLVDVLMFSVNPAFDLLPAQTDIDSLFMDSTFNENYFQIDNDRAELYRLCEEKDIAITNMKTLAGGRLLNKEASPFGVALTPVQCIHYALERPAMKSVLMGARTIEELELCLKYETATKEEKDYTIIAKGSRSAISGKCMYCNHCLPCPANIDIASVTKYLDIATLSDTVPDTIKEHYATLSAHGNDCISCKSCESNCPFNVAVCDNMAKASQVFGY